MYKVYMRHVSFHLIWIMTLLEAITVPLLVFLVHHQSAHAAPKSMWHGFIIGTVGCFILFFIINFYLSKLKLIIDNGILLRIQPIIIVALWSGILLACLFLFQKVGAIIQIFLTNSLLLMAMVGFIATAGSIIVTYYLYVLLRPWQYFLITITTTKSRYFLWKIPILAIAVYAGIYEAIALPIINSWMLITHHQTLDSIFLGACGGLVGSTVVVVLYNILSRFHPIYFSFKNCAIR